ncbi:hypothetical protein DQ04_15121000 [Trypanosoma grayi]|uniref:hypothetical protein n=1 Tax=Trypanosoma grayi TaxID=71804 RepID=UPI0004F4461E|nr:hypothetical protein DQ04_15121000 [Trypanosoma grayi]KEG06229.1 hypothetical protein DQ04_15121000 [Trypanosoma grayi]
MVRAGIVAGIKTEDAAQWDTSDIKERTRQDAWNTTHYARNMLEKAESAAQKAITALEKAKEAVKAAQRTLEAVEAARRVAQEGSKPTNTKLVKPQTIQGSTQPPLQDKQEANGEAATDALNEGPEESVEVPVPSNGGHEAERRRDEPDGLQAAKQTTVLPASEPADIAATSNEHTGEKPSAVNDKDDAPLLPSSSVVSAVMGGSGSTDGSGTTGWMCAPPLLLVIGA